MVIGTHIALTGQHDFWVWQIALVPFLLVNNLLLLNQYPDIDAEASVGRVTFPIAFGVKQSNRVYIVFALLAYFSIFVLIVQNRIPLLSLIAIFPIVFSLFAFFGASKHLANIADKPYYLGANVTVAILTPLLLGGSLIFN